MTTTRRGRCLGRRLVGLDLASPEDPCTGRPKTVQIGPRPAGGRNVSICIRDLYENREGFVPGPNRPFSCPGVVEFWTCPTTTFVVRLW